MKFGRKGANDSGGGGKTGKGRGEEEKHSPPPPKHRARKEIKHVLINKCVWRFQILLKKENRRGPRGGRGRGAGGLRKVNQRSVSVARIRALLIEVLHQEIDQNTKIQESE